MEQGLETAAELKLFPTERMDLWHCDPAIDIENLSLAAASSDIDEDTCTMISSFALHEVRGLPTLRQGEEFVSGPTSDFCNLH